MFQIAAMSFGSRSILKQATSKLAGVPPWF
jgi:hypothetical protein